MEIKRIIEKFKVPTDVIISYGMSNWLVVPFKKLGFYNKKILLVADQNTYLALGIDIFNILNKSCGKLILESPKADEETVLKIQNYAKDYDLIAAVGSGTINDLCKLASFRNKIPYLIFGTAASMNGYASANASIIIGNKKTSVAAHMPIGIYMNLDVINKAPERLTRAGLGDSMCLSTCQFDWLLSSLILETDYNSLPLYLLRFKYEKLFALSNNIDHPKFIYILTKTLIISGMAMYIVGGSYPASQSEHLIAHYIEIQHPEIAAKSYHGEQIAVNTLTATKIQEKILELDNIQIKPTEITENDLKKIFREDLARYFYKEIQSKFIDKEMVEKINLKLKNDWPVIKKQLQKFHRKSDDLIALYNKFSLPKNASEVGVSDSIYQEAVDNAHLIRNRFTALDFIKLIKQ